MMPGPIQEKEEKGENIARRKQHIRCNQFIELLGARQRKELGSPELYCKLRVGLQTFDGEWQAASPLFSPFSHFSSLFFHFFSTFSPLFLHFFSLFFFYLSLFFFFPISLFSRRVWLPWGWNTGSFSGHVDTDARTYMESILQCMTYVPPLGPTAEASRGAKRSGKSKNTQGLNCRSRHY